MEETRKKNRGKKRSRRMQRHRTSVLAVSAVIILLLAVVSVNSVTLKAQESEYETQIAELESQIDEEKSRSKQIDKLEEYVGTDEYIEDVAKDKLGLIHENEIIFRAQ
ncbi:FtsB family cell division protein [Mordavella massiliensis]|jgi:cell division protein DivIC|uniref:Septum formation initiator family protein n=1 Tax=Mordavella massiliensis TaxID=1871024 RepID=A0A938X2V5_9CLOT|nr:septum formation initiator family protein [Mordavella massiliensis]MBM6827437.1 septum formation initiator family protein [Mordavella massiliensis]MBM6969596.1 septum formation initiator family protein [Mordavella massiliensis]HJB87528.1 septum formation initiator family protein [Candidatus Dorea faecigallinarum]